MSFTAYLKQELEKAGTQKNSTPMEAYMKHHFSFYGVRSAERKAILSSGLQKFGKPNAKKANPLAHELWKENHREIHYCCQEMLHRIKHFEEETSIQLFKWLITNNSWWDSIDFLAPNLVGSYFQIYPENRKRILPVWNKSDNMWLVRSTIIYQLKYKAKTDFEIMTQMILPHTESKEFFIQKAIGWALREYAKTNSQEVKQFVDATQLAPLSRREALKHF